MQFHEFKQNVKNSPLLEAENENIKQVSLYLDENEDEEISLLRYNRCLTLVPSSKRSFMETLRNFQPHVVMERVMEHEAAYPRKRPRLDTVEEREQLADLPVKGESVEASSTVAESVDFIEETLEAEAEEAIEDLTVEEWLEAAVRTAEFSENNGECDSWVCTYCDQHEKFVDLAEFREHLLTYHIPYYDGMNFDQVVFEESEEQTIQEYQSISEDVTADKTQQQYIIYQCTNCSFACESRKAFTIHQKSHADRKPRLIQAGKYERFCCTDCCYQFSSHSHYQAHLNGHQLFEIVAKHSTHPTCDECQMMFCDEAYFNLHQESHGTHQATELILAEGFFLKYGVERLDLRTEEANVERPIKCGHCARTFDDYESCRLHQMIFHVKTLRCPIEFREFNGNQAFSIHLKNNHPELFGNDIKFKCSVCKMEFDSLYAKLGHMKTCDKKSFPCTHCDKKFSQKCYLTMHLRRVTGQISVTCELCDKVCGDKGDYTIHMRSHSNVKPFKCSICPKAYKTSSARAAHLETHMEKGFTCSYCKALFNSRRTLTKHVKTKHFTSMEAENQTEDGIIAVEVLPGEVY